MKTHAPLLLAISALIFSQAANAQPVEAKTVPVGVVTLTLPGGNGVSRTSTVISFPLLEFPTSAGKITSVSPNSVSSVSAGWIPGQFSSPSAPYILRIKTGAAAGRTFLISSSSANTATIIFIDPTEASQTDLTSLGIISGTDAYEIQPCDTLSSLFGTPETTGVKGGTAASNSDNLSIFVSGSWRTYYFNTTNNRWSLSAFGNPDSTNLPIKPDAGIIYSRLETSALEITFTGVVPSVDRKAVVANSGVSFLSNGWPVDQTLAATQIQNLPGWTSAPAITNADVVTLFVSGSWRSYWYDGTNWRLSAFGNPVSNNQPIIAGTGLILNQKGSAPGSSILAQVKPYAN